MQGRSKTKKKAPGSAYRGGGFCMNIDSFILTHWPIRFLALEPSPRRPLYEYLPHIRW